MKNHDNFRLLMLTVSLFSRKKYHKETEEKICCLFGNTLIKVETENYEQYLEYIGAGKMTVNKFLLLTAGFLPSRYNRSNTGTISKFQDYYRKPEKSHLKKWNYPDWNDHESNEDADHSAWRRQTMANKAIFFNL